MAGIYRCTNFGNCSKADGGEQMQPPVGAAPVCTECGLPLMDVSSKQPKKILPLLLAACGALALGGIGFWLFMGPTPPDSLDTRAELEWEQQARQEAERRALEAERLARQEAERRALEVEQQAKQEAERRALEVEQQAKQEAERQARQEAERRVLEAERQARQEAERRALEAEWQTRQQVESRSRQQVERRVLEAERQTRQQAERRALAAERQAEARRQVKSDTTDRTLLSPSFDCTKATTNIENLICNNRLLSDVDGRLGRVYRSLLKSLPRSEADQLKREQINWIKQRDYKLNTNCLTSLGYDINCVSQLWERRIAELQSR